MSSLHYCITLTASNASNVLYSFRMLRLFILFKCSLEQLYFYTFPFHNILSLAIGNSRLVISKGFTRGGGDVEPSTRGAAGDDNGHPLVGVGVRGQQVTGAAEGAWGILCYS